MSYLVQYPDIVGGLLLEHISITVQSLLVALALALPLGWAITTYRRLAGPLLGLLSLLYTIPSLALLILLIPLFGLTTTTVSVALVLYSQVILVRNVVAGLQAIDPAILDAARGMGMNAWQRWWRVQLPLALPVILAGVRIAAVAAIAIATIGAKVGAGGLGTLLFDGIAQAGRYDKIWAGALAVSALALAVNTALLTLERLVTPGARLRRATTGERTRVAAYETAQPMPGPH